MGYTLNNIKKCPFKGLSSSWISSDFGNRKFWNNVTQQWNSGFHNGIDMTSGTKIVAVASGKVTACRNSVKGYTESQASGNYVTLYHGNNVYTTYCHMTYGSVKVKVGDIVDGGQELGTKGTTGYSTGPHLHFGIKVNGSWVDPKPYLLGTKTIPEYKSVAPSTNNGSGYTKFNVGDKVIFTGTLYRDSYGNGAGQTRTNLEATIYLVNEGAKCPYNINKGLGWVRTEDLKAITSSNNKYYTVVKGDTLSGIASRHNTTYKKLYELNKTLIDNENKKRGVATSKMWVYPGQKLLLP